MPRRTKSGWLAEWRVGYGRGAPRRSKVMPTKAAAAALEERMREAQRRGEYVDPREAQTPFRDVAEDLVDTTADASTRALYESRLRLHVLPVLGDRPIGQITEADFDVLATRLRAKGLAPSMQRGVVSLAMRVMHRAVRRRMRAAAPAVTLPKAPRAEVVVITPAQAQALLAATAPRARAAVALGLGCGLRQGEVLGLTVARVDFLRRRVHVVEQADPRRPGERKAPKTAASRRSVPLPDWVAAELAAHLAQWPGDDVVFRSQRGHAWRGSTFNRAIWKPALRGAGLPETYGFHVTRHFFVSALADRGVPIATVAKLLGHANVMETIRTYLHLFPDSDEAPRRALDGLFGDPGSEPGTNRGRTTTRG